jgi:hypothetical protein
MIVRSSYRAVYRIRHWKAELAALVGIADPKWPRVIGSDDTSLSPWACGHRQQLRELRRAQLREVRA